MFETQFMQTNHTNNCFVEFCVFYLQNKGFVIQTNTNKVIALTVYFN